ncbi:phosphoglycerate dehydrogenase [Pseudobacteriovorax antillogorgiicola]|uniref:D-3-phosphoglycerate dehydrogenase n=1 Tax=Pseudobacteriovorax antillogorgiicola TaxID=1513793 RepID=A0A1Y6B7M9_9BACT|nr:phosphoglycerate dehydrogenase [Pseudobacteriovorax antillogorgiicola]TCS59319.1 D-3-phosphoglycerate dehydrogenase [Pseudobacteriovorax antillogorgiicola]SME89429.1 D-3-phosphoglycerate dehydrogenase [Pseudobacteriovorax antillogorgiicola]
MTAPVVAVSAQSFAKDERLRRSAAERFPHFEFRFCNPGIPWTSASLLQFLQGADLWLVGKEPVTKACLSQLPQLNGITKYGVGLDNIDFEACHARQLPVYFESGVNSQEVAEQAIAMMIGMSRKLFYSSEQMKADRWVKNGGVNFTGKVVSVIGCGHVGSKVATLARAFQCEVLICDILDKAAFAASIGAKQVSFENALQSSDFLTLHVPLTDKTLKFVGERQLEGMKPGSFLVNTCRGEVVDQESLKHCLKTGPLAGAALDVFEEEPCLDKDLYSLDNFVGTAHIAGNSREAVWKMGQAALNGVEKILLDR